MKKEKSSKTSQSRGPIQKRIISITLGGITFICLIIAIISYYIFTNYLQNSMVSSTKTNLLNLGESLNSGVDDVFRIARYCQGSSDIANYIEASPEPGSVLSVATHDRLYEEYQGNESNSYIPRVVVIAGGNFLQACTTTFSTTANLATLVPKLPFFDELLNAQTYNFSPGIISDPFIINKSRTVIPIVRPITYKFNSDQIGYLYMEFSTELLTRPMQHYYLDKGSSLYLTMENHIYRFENGNLVKLADDYLDINKIVLNFGNDSTSVIHTETGKDKSTIVAVPLKMNNCYLLQSVSPASLKSERRSLLLVLTIVLTSTVAVGITMTLLLDRFIHRPLQMIREKIKLTTEGDFSRDPSIEWPHEMGEIGRGINDLSESINTLLDAKLKDEKQKRDLEYQMLQSQINPHFLYNTLNSIKMMATTQGATGISEMTTALASLLRSISKGTSLLVPIKEELSLVSNYFTIQNYRYGGMIGFDILLKDPEIETCKILKFTLQPLVENAIFHGLEPKGGIGNITITLSYVNSEITPASRDILIEVYDDGVGITPEKIDIIMNGGSGGKAEFFKEIGVSNVHSRLKYEFGEGYGIFIESAEGRYTKMNVLIPERKE